MFLRPLVRGRFQKEATHTDGLNMTREVENTNHELYDSDDYWLG